MNDKQENNIVNTYSNMDIYWTSAKTEICFSSDKESTNLRFHNKHAINMTKNLIMRSILESSGLAKNGDPVIISDCIEFNNFHPKRKDVYTVSVVIKPSWDKILYDIKFSVNNSEGSSEEGTESNKYSEYITCDLTQNDIMCILHHLLPKTSKHILRRKHLEDKAGYVASVKHIAPSRFKR